MTCCLSGLWAARLTFAAALLIGLTAASLQAQTPDRAAPPGSGATQGPDATPETRLLNILVTAYPDFLSRHENGQLVWTDGTRMDLGGRRPEGFGKTAGDLHALFAAPSLRDMFHWTYPQRLSASVPPEPDADPGRIRVEAFFTRMYGDCRKGEVAAHLVPVAWLPKKKGGTVRVTRVNGVATRLAAVSAELDALPASFDTYLIPSSGTYNCRRIAGTTRPSAHATGTAIDLAARHAQYWRWRKPGPGGRAADRNAIPLEIVDIFEKHGFIWGGKWSHFDTMHFEYRPEILAAGRQ